MQISLVRHNSVSQPWRPRAPLSYRADRKTVANVAFASLLPRDIAAQRRQHPVPSIKCPMCRQDIESPSGLHTVHVSCPSCGSGARAEAGNSHRFYYVRDKLWASMVGHMRSDACVSFDPLTRPSPPRRSRFGALVIFVLIRSDKSPTDIFRTTAWPGLPKGYFSEE